MAGETEKMVDSGSAELATTTAPLPANTTVKINIHYDPIYIRTLPGMLKITQLTLNMLGCIFTQDSIYFVICSVIGSCVTGMLLISYIFHIVENFHKIPWLKLELIFCALWTILYFVATFLVAYLDAPFDIVPIFLIMCAMLAYGFDAHLKRRALQSEEFVRAARIINNQTATSPSAPQY